MEMDDEKQEGCINYDNMTDEEYYQEMEKKVEYYKKHYPDMYEKAEQWIKMLDHSEVYKNNSGDTSGENPEYYQAEDILKNMKFNGLEEEDVCTADIVLLNKHIPDWKEKVTQFLQGNE